MPFMKPEIIKGDWLVVETTRGTYCGLKEEPITFDNKATINESNTYFDYYGVRLSAPGYMDCTDWAIFKTIEECRVFLETQHEVCSYCGESIYDELGNANEGDACLVCKEKFSN